VVYPYPVPRGGHYHCRRLHSPSRSETAMIINGADVTSEDAVNAPGP
jgi:hypothetical protein